jgi:hypothetical protein
LQWLQAAEIATGYIWLSTLVVLLSERAVLTCLLWQLVELLPSTNASCPQPQDVSSSDVELLLCEGSNDKIGKETMGVTYQLCCLKHAMLMEVLYSWMLMGAV